MAQWPTYGLLITINPNFSIFHSCTTPPRNTNTKHRIALTPILKLRPTDQPTNLIQKFVNQLRVDLHAFILPYFLRFLVICGGLRCSGRRGTSILSAEEKLGTMPPARLLQSDGANVQRDDEWRRRSSICKCDEHSRPCTAAASVREYVFYVFFQISKKHDFLRFFEMAYQKVVKSL